MTTATTTTMVNGHAIAIVVKMHMLDTLGSALLLFVFFVVSAATPMSALLAAA